MNKFTLYLLRSFLFLFFLCTVGTVVIFIVLDFVGNSRVWLQRPPEEVYTYYLNYIPQIVFLILPISILLATVFTTGAMARHLELVALRATGLSIYRIFLPLFLFGIFATAGMFYFGEKVVPASNHIIFKIREPQAEQRGPENLGDPSERYNFLFNGSDGTTYFMRFYSSHSKKGQGVTLLRKEKGILLTRYDAQAIEWDGNHWRLIKGSERHFVNKGLESKTFEEKSLPFLADGPSDLLQDKTVPDEMNLLELQHQMNILKRMGEPTFFLETHRYFRFASPWVNFFMVILGVSMACHSVRSGLAKNFGLALLVTFAYYVALRFGLVLGFNGTLTPIVAAWIGYVIFGSLAFILLWRAGRT